MAKKKQAESSNFNKTKRLALTGLLFAIALMLSLVESSLPPLIITIPGIKIGLSNIIVMYSLFFLGKREAYMIAILKAIFVFVIRGPISAILSLCGGVLSVSIMLMLMLILSKKASYLIISITGAVFHNIGQLITVSIIYVNIYTLAFLPALLISAVISGSLTTVLLRLALPAFNQFRAK